MDVFRTYLKANRGEQRRIAGALGINEAAVSRWRKVPAEHVLNVETLTGLSRYDLRPDVFGTREGAG